MRVKKSSAMLTMFTLFMGATALLVSAPWGYITCFLAGTYFAAYIIATRIEKERAKMQNWLSEMKKALEQQERLSKLNNGTPYGDSK
jgi:hypothetical protein